MKIAKLIFGAKNTDTEKLKEFIKIYALAGADIFDVCADREIIDVVRDVLNSLNLPLMPKICASITLQNDIHAAKVKVNSAKCILCKRCVNICPQKVIACKKNIEINEKGCVGCKLCLSVCQNNALEIYFAQSEFLEQFENVKNSDCIEIHTNGHDKDLFDVFEFLKANFSGEIGICISNNSDTAEKINIIEKVKNIISPKILIVQADGNSISGINNDKTTTQKAIDECKNFQNLENIVLIASGGTNENSAKMAKEQLVFIDGVAWGSYARKILSDENPFEQAKKLVHSVK